MLRKWLISHIQLDELYRAWYLSPLLLPLFGRRPFGYHSWLRLQVLPAVIQSSSAAAVLCLFVFVLLLLIRLIIYQPIYQSLSHSIYAFLSCVLFQFEYSCMFWLSISYTVIRNSFSCNNLRDVSFDAFETRVCIQSIITVVCRSVSLSVETKTKWIRVEGKWMERAVAKGKQSDCTATFAGVCFRCWTEFCEKWE